MESHYDVLGLSPDADDARVRRAYRLLSKEYHPDQGGSREQFRRIKEAYEQITGERPPAERTNGAAVPGSTFVDDRSETQAAPASDHERGLTVEGRYLTLTLSGLLQDVTLADLFDAPVNAASDRTVAFFEATNASSRVLPWAGTDHTSFVGDDGFLYESASVHTPPTEGLPPAWCGSDVDLGPGRSVNAVVVAAEIPDDVSVERVVYTQHVPSLESSGYDDTERYLFEIEPLIGDRLDRVPFDRV